MPISEEEADKLADMIENGEIEVGEPLAREDWPEPLRSQGRGRPTFDGSNGASPLVTVRLSPELRKRAVQRAESEGVSLSELTRQALEAYLG